jgi:transcriptional regulator with XRE-family HTH domain
MSRPNVRSTPVLVTEVRRSLLLSQEELGKRLGVSRKTAGRYETGQSQLYDRSFHLLARLVHPVDASLARELAAAGYTTLEELGIAEAKGPLQKSAPAHVLGHALVCAAAEVLDASPRAMRPVLLAALQVAKELGLTVDEAVTALESAPAAPASPRKESAPAKKEPRKAQ